MTTVQPKHKKKGPEGPLVICRRGLGGCQRTRLHARRNYRKPRLLNLRSSNWPFQETLKLECGPLNTEGKVKRWRWGEIRDLWKTQDQQVEP